jgi:hypothetical protein
VGGFIYTNYRIRGVRYFERFPISWKFERSRDASVRWNKFVNTWFEKNSLLHEVYVTVPLQEFEITHPIKIFLRAQFHFCVLDDVS